MTQPGDPELPVLDAELARSLAETLHAMRRNGGEHRTLREHIANRVRVKNRIAEALYVRFDQGWHAGVSASLGKDVAQPSLDNDPLGHFAFEAARGRTSSLIAERTAQPDAPGASDATPHMTPSEKYFLRRSAIVAGIVVAVTWLLSDATGWKLPAVLFAAGSLAFVISTQMATVIENGVMVALVLVVALAVASAGFGEVFWPSFLGAIVGAIDGMLQRVRWERLSREAADGVNEKRSAH